jgi:hypothetical protein
LGIYARQRNKEEADSRAREKRAKEEDDEYYIRTSEREKVLAEIAKNNPNPDPKNFKIIKTQQIGESLILMVNYPNCTNFEGDKILFYVNYLSLKAEACSSPNIG